MRIKWRGLELPSSITVDPRSAAPDYAKFSIEPFERGFGTTIGNSLRRVLLSSLEGAAVTSVKIAGAEHEFSSLPGVVEDVTDIILNVKNLIVNVESEEPKTLRLAATGPGEVTADLIEADTAVTVVNKDLVIATLSGEVDFDMELRVERGRGYVPASEQYADADEQEIGRIPVDAIYSPVQRVRYKVEETRVGQRVNYDRLVMEIWTDGTITPEMALVEAAKILRKHLNPFVQFAELGEARVSQEAAAAASVDDALVRKLQSPITDLELSVRASNCLESSQILTVADLVSRDEAELLKVRSFGKTSLREVKRKLAEWDLSLGMELPEGVRTG
ncbi:MAG: DNA-directed RNA polymerase subunit alpha [Planctomycetota bacterium]|nr:MAG: DNA-directed RNA polymerase subunit alpha [Planctomycetota bacterium]